MTRRALIIFCNNTKSGQLTGPVIDNLNFRNFLMSNIGGDWYPGEIQSLQNPTASEVSRVINTFLNDADYTFILFSGHGFVHQENGLQYMELRDAEISTIQLRTTALRQTLIVDACRGYYLPEEQITKAFGDVFESLTGIISTRKIFEKAVLMADQGWTILFAASENQTALDTRNGGAYLRSLLEVAEEWQQRDNEHDYVALNVIHVWTKKYLLENFETNQIPDMNVEKRRLYFPFAVKFRNV